MSAPPDSFDLYNDTLMAYVSRIKPEDRLEHPTASASAYSPICGTEITIDLNIDTGKITDIGYDSGSACALTKTVLAVLLDHGQGRSKEEIERGYKALNALLDEGQNPEGLWADLKVLAPTRTYTARHNSMRLPFEATLKAFSG